MDFEYRNQKLNDDTGKSKVYDRKEKTPKNGPEVGQASPRRQGWVHGEHQQHAPAGFFKNRCN